MTASAVSIGAIPPAPTAQCHEAILAWGIQHTCLDHLAARLIYLVFIGTQALRRCDFCRSPRGRGICAREEQFQWPAVRPAIRAALTNSEGSGWPWVLDSNSLLPAHVYTTATGMLLALGRAICYKRAAVMRNGRYCHLFPTLGGQRLFITCSPRHPSTHTAPDVEFGPTLEDVHERGGVMSARMWYTFQSPAGDRALQTDQKAQRVQPLKVLPSRFRLISKQHTCEALASLAAHSILPFESARLLQAPVFDTF